MDIIGLRPLIETACRHLLSEQDRDPYSLTYGCFDRRYWAWKLADFPEATFQRNVYPSAWMAGRAGQTTKDAEMWTSTALAGLSYAARIQHPDGSFDQAFPHEHSFGATAFLLHSLLSAYQIVSASCSQEAKTSIETGLRRAADFLGRADETHGHIANHVAGAVLALLLSAELFAEPGYKARGMVLLDRLLKHQSSEGWFLEYEGADPGYQTLCLYYLAQVYGLHPDARLKDALARSIDFLAWFVHPDGTFGGEYGCRRTAVYYPGGVALLSGEFSLARSMDRFMLAALLKGQTVTPADVDMGNLAPLLSNYITALEVDRNEEKPPAPPLPWEVEDHGRDFKDAGLFVRAKGDYYAIVGGSNGGVLKIFDRKKRALLWNDGGFVGKTATGDYLTTQVTDVSRPCRATAEEIQISTPFYVMRRSAPRPIQFVLLRVLNLTAMRWIRFGNWIKTRLVKRLITGKRATALDLIRTIRFEKEHVIIHDVVRSHAPMALAWLEFGRPFVAIHMASARYFENASSAGSGWPARSISVETLRRDSFVESEVVI